MGMMWILGLVVGWIVAGHLIAPMLGGSVTQGLRLTNPQLGQQLERGGKYGGYGY